MARKECIMSRTIPVAALALAVFTLAGDVAHAQSKCAADKIKAACKKSTCKAGLEAKEAQTGTAPDPAKLAKCEASFSKSYAKAESKGGCPTTGDAAAVEAKVDAFVTDLDGELNVGSGTNPNKCEADKLKAAAKKAGCKCALEAKQAQTAGNPPPDPAKLQKCEASFSKSFAKLEAKGGCNTTSDAAVIESKVDAFVVDVDAGISPPACCGAAEIVTTSTAGRLVVDSLGAFPFPPGVSTTYRTTAPDLACKHDASVEAYAVPVFCIPALGYTSRITALGCESGSALGKGTAYDVGSPCADADVVRLADTSDGTCNPGGQPCNAGAGGAGMNTLGNINTTRGDTLCDAVGGHTQLDIPVDSLTWADGDGNPDCPDEDSTFDGGDLLITQFSFILSPTTSQARAQFMDLNADSCSFAGAGPVMTRRCSNDHSKPCGAGSDCPGGTCVPGALEGKPATECCTVGQASTMVATGLAFSGAPPLFDLLFSNQTPQTVTACNAAGTLSTCTLTTDPCAD
jgi:hypothetical protein